MADPGIARGLYRIKLGSVDAASFGPFEKIGPGSEREFFSVFSSLSWLLSAHVHS